MHRLDDDEGLASIVSSNLCNRGIAVAFADVYAGSIWSRRDVIKAEQCGGKGNGGVTMAVNKRSGCLRSAIYVYASIIFHPWLYDSPIGLGLL